MLKMLLFVLLLMATLIHAEDSNIIADWSKCPKMCRCKWSSGKRTADCTGGGYETLPNFPQPDLIQVLVMDNNPVGHLPAQMFQLSGLINAQKIFMRNCSITDIHATAFEGLVILIELDLSYNLIQSLKPGTFAGDVRLRKLRISYNNIRSLVHFSFPSMAHLRLIDLSSNKLVKLGAFTFSALDANLEVLRLHDNKLRRLESRPFTRLHRLKSLTLGANPWHCDCRLKDLWLWFKAKRLLDSATCSSPPNLKGRGWHSLESSEHLACVPVVTAPQPTVSVSKGEQALLSCKLIEGYKADLRWVREGTVVANNSDNNDGLHYVIYSGEKWFNLTIDNVQRPSVHDLYTCMAQNEGGISEANVTLVHSPSVATYVGDADEIMSWLLCTGTVAGVMVFLLISLWMFCFMQRSNGQQKHVDVNESSHHLMFALGEDTNNHNQHEEEEEPIPKPNNRVELNSPNNTSRQLRQMTAMARAQRTRNSSFSSVDNVSSRAIMNSKAILSSHHPFPDLLNCHQQQQQQQQRKSTSLTLAGEQQQCTSPAANYNCRASTNTSYIGEMAHFSHSSDNYISNMQQQPPPPPPFPEQKRLAHKSFIPTKNLQYNAGKSCYSTITAAETVYFNGERRPAIIHKGHEKAYAPTAYNNENVSSSMMQLQNDNTYTNTGLLNGTVSDYCKLPVQLSSTSHLLNNREKAQRTMEFLQHTIESRNRVLQSLVRDKSDTLV